MVSIERNLATYVGLTPEAKTAAAIAVACGCSLGAYYAAEDGEGKELKRKSSVGIYEKSDTDPFEDSISFNKEKPNPNHIPIYGNNGAGKSILKGVVVVERGANIHEPQVGIDKDKRRIANVIAEMVAPYLPKPGESTSPMVPMTQEVTLEYFHRIKEISVDILSRRIKPGYQHPHPELLHSESVAEILKITFAGTPLADTYYAAYQIHDIGKICSLPPNWLMPEVNQEMVPDDLKKRYFAERNSGHPFDLIILFPFVNQEILLNTALHHLSLSAGERSVGVNPSEMTDVVKFSRVADVFAAMTDNARYPKGAHSAEKALAELLSKAINIKHDIPLEHLGMMLAAGVFEKYIGQRKGRDLKAGGIEANIEEFKKVEDKILIYIGKSREILTSELQSTLRSGRTFS